ncbi:Tim44 domain-containing protein [Meloidogyne graminicola]|uniref:Tim44 domain-containing protein n=1 Tax=Meloidogyne graminicola TaxID=189291 RepID=A0A8S9ZLX8_9BILA|nr:Tim44 domain-containing protein [Meloidogyne graminicola]
MTGVMKDINEYSKIGYNTLDSQIIDVSKVEMVSGKMMDQGPALVITFQVFMIHVLKKFEGKNNAIRVHHVWVLCRDMEEFNPATAWKLLELHVQPGQLRLKKIFFLLFSSMDYDNESDEAMDLDQHQRKFFDVGPFDYNKVDLNKPAMTAEEYLKQVIVGRSQEPAIAVASNLSLIMAPSPTTSKFNNSIENQNFIFPY